MLTTAALHELLEARRKELGLSHMQLGVKAFGRDDASTLHNIKRGSSPTYERLGQIVEALGWEIVIGPSRQMGFAEPDPSTDLTAISGLRAGYLPIPWLDAAAGKGSSPIALHKNYLDQIGLQVDRLRAIIPDETQASIGRTGRGVAILDPLAARKGMSLWAHRTGGKCIVSLVSFDAPAAIIMPDSPLQPPKLISDMNSSEVRFLGRVDLIVKAT